MAMNVDLLLQQAPALPSFPKVAQEVIKSLNQLSVSISEISRKLAADQVLSAKILRLANSSYYSVPRTISTIDDAVKLLGLVAVRTVVVSTSITSGFKPVAGLDLREYWLYSLHTAAAARYYAKFARCSADLAFTAGLLHGIGCLVMIAGMPEEMAEMNTTIPPYPSEKRIAAERDTFGFTYADVGAELVRRWNFPDGFSEAIKGAAHPLEWDAEPVHGAIFVGAWRARTEQLKMSDAELRESLPQAVMDKIGLSRDCVMDMPPFNELCDGLEELIN